MLCPHMSYHQHNRHLLPTLLTLDPPLLPLPVGGSLSRHLSPARHLQMSAHRLSWEADHAKCLPRIGPQAYPIKQAEQGAKCALEPSWVQQCDNAIIRVEEGILMPTLLSTLAPLFCSLHHHRHPVPHHHIHPHIETGGGGGLHDALPI